MSGFAFHIACTNCQLTSAQYPFRLDSTVAPSQLELPSLDRNRHVFDRLVLPIERVPDDAELEAIAAERSTPSVTICVPYFSDVSVELRPAAPCPRCGVSALACRFGAAAQPINRVSTIDQLIQRSQDLEAGATVSSELTTPSARIGCTRDARGSTYQWRIERVGTVDQIDVVTGQLRASLLAMGSACSEPRRLRAFARFDEIRRRESAG